MVRRTSFGPWALSLTSDLELHETPTRDFKKNNPQSINWSKNSLLQVMEAWLRFYRRVQSGVHLQVFSQPAGDPLLSGYVETMFKTSNINKEMIFFFKKQMLNSVDPKGLFITTTIIKLFGPLKQKEIKLFYMLVK